MSDRYGLKVWYHGNIQRELDDTIKKTAVGGEWWAQGYDFGEDVRDIAFDYDNPIQRDMAIVELEALEGVHTEKRDR